MIKWKFVIIRLCILAAFIGLLHFGTGPLLYWVIQTSVQTVSGSKLEMEDFNASPFQTRISSGKVRLGHPKKITENLFDFKDAELQFDQASLLRKKFIVTTGSVNGLEFGTGRSDSGKLEDDPSGQPSLVNDFLLATGKKAAHGFADLLNKRFEENFETVRYSREVIDRWPDEYEKLLQRGKGLEKRIREIRDLADSFKANPLNTLRDVPKIEQSIQDAVRIRSELSSIRNQLVQYRTQVLLDRDNILSAKRRDLARIQEIKTDKRLNGRSLSQLLIGDKQGQRVDLAISWVKWMRKTFPHPKKSIKASRSRGQTIRFEGQVDQPDLLIKSLAINGHGTVEEKPYTFTGTLAGITTQPEVYGKPAYLQLVAAGDIDFSVKGMIDRSRPVDHDRVIVNIPSLKVSAQDLELDDDVVLRLGKSQLQLDARIDLVGEELSGQIKVVQRDVQVSVDADLKNGFATEMKQMLNQDLESIRKFEVVARLSGSASKPQWHFHSDLGPQISQAINGTLARGYEKKKAELIAKLNGESEKALNKVADLIKTQEAKVLSFVGEKASDVFQLEERVSSLLKFGGLRFR